MPEGIGTGKLARFSDERVFADIDYIGAQNPASANIFIVDANFSIPSVTSTLRAISIRAIKSTVSPAMSVANGTSLGPTA